MKLTPISTFEQNFKPKASEPIQKTKFIKSFEDLRFGINNVYFCYVLPKVLSINTDEDTCQIDYPFERIATHFGLYNFMQEHCGMKSHRLNCDQTCPICEWMGSGRKPPEIFKTGIANGFQVAYVIDINDKKTKIAWFPDYLHRIYENKLGELMNSKSINLIEALSFKIKIYTANPNTKEPLDAEIDLTSKLPVEDEGFKSLLVKINSKPLVDIIQKELLTTNDKLKIIFAKLKERNDVILREEASTRREQKLEEGEAQLQAMVNGFGDLDKLMKTNELNNPVITDETKQLSINNEDPF
jgi:hypothetical protein